MSYLAPEVRRPCQRAGGNGSSDQRKAEDGPGERRPAATHPQPDEAEHAECFDEPERDQRRLLVRLHPGLYVTRRTLDEILRRFTSEVRRNRSQR